MFLLSPIGNMPLRIPLTGTKKRKNRAFVTKKSIRWSNFLTNTIIFYYTSVAKHLKSKKTFGMSMKRWLDIVAEFGNPERIWYFRGSRVILMRKSIHRGQIYTSDDGYSFFVQYNCFLGIKWSPERNKHIMHILKLHKNRINC